MGSFFKWHYLLIASGILLVISGGSTSFVIDKYNLDWRLNFIGEFLAVIGGVFLALGWHQKATFKCYRSKPFIKSFSRYTKLSENGNKCFDFIKDWSQQIELVAHDLDYDWLAYLSTMSMSAAAEGPKGCQRLIIDMWKNVLGVNKKNKLIVQAILTGIALLIFKLKEPAYMDDQRFTVHEQLTTRGITIKDVPLSQEGKMRFTWALSVLEDFFHYMLALEREWVLRNQKLLFTLTYSLATGPFATLEGKVSTSILNETTKDISNVLTPFRKELQSL